MKNATEDRLRKLGIPAAELDETFARSAGPGGQHVNKTSTAVTVRWRGFSASAQDSRSQSANRDLARQRLCDAVESARKAARLAARQAKEKERRRNAPRPPRLKKRILEAKRRRSETKKLRGNVDA